MLAALAKRELTFDKLAMAFYATAEAADMISLICIGSDLMNLSLALTQLPNRLAGLVQGWAWAPVKVVIAMLLLKIPIFFPIVNCMAKDTSMAESYRGVMPFLISDTLRMAAVICLPGIAFGLVRFVS